MISTTQLNTNSTNHVYDNNVHSCKAIKKKWWRIWRLIYF